MPEEGQGPELGGLGVSIRRGFLEDQRDDTALLFWEAFSGKLGKILMPEVRALRLIRRILDPEFAFSAVSHDGKLLGLAGFKTSEGGFSGGDLSDLVSVYGLFGGLWRGILLELLERPLKRDVLLMDGIFVHADARGKGVGTMLLDAIVDEARCRNLSSVRLDVIDTNPRARALYERAGFVAGATEEVGFLSDILGFRSTTTMIRRLGPGSTASSWQ